MSFLQVEKPSKIKFKFGVEFVVEVNVGYIGYHVKILNRIGQKITKLQ